jgi:ribosome-binding protein aMBF1 (putative translation factor)
MKDGLLDRNDGCSADDLNLLRLQRGMSEQELADSIGHTARCIRNCEAGAVSPQQ